MLKTIIMIFVLTIIFALSKKSKIIINNKEIEGFLPRLPYSILASITVTILIWWFFILPIMGIISLF